MNRFIVLCLGTCCLGVAGCTAATPQESAPVPRCDGPAREAGGQFSKLNPHYKDRAGVFYDIRYVSPSAEALFKIADIRPDQMRRTMEILRRFVDEWLDFYVGGEGAITEAEVARCVRRMDERFDELLDDLQRRQYRIWRDDATGEHNHLRFLMMAHPSVGPEAKVPPSPKDDPGRERGGPAGQAKE